MVASAGPHDSALRATLINLRVALFSKREDLSCQEEKILKKF